LIADFRLRGTRVCTGLAFFGASLTMIVVVLAAFVCTHATHGFAESKILFFNFTLPLNEPRSLHAYVGTVAGQFYAPGKERNIFFIQTSGFTVFARNGAVDQSLLKFFLGSRFRSCCSVSGHRLSFSAKAKYLCQMRGEASRTILHTRISKG
jgi:hypothetical protein